MVYFFWPNLLLPAWPIMCVISSFFTAQIFGILEIGNMWGPQISSSPNHRQGRRWIFEICAFFSLSLIWPFRFPSQLIWPFPSCSAPAASSQLAVFFSHIIPAAVFSTSQPTVFSSHTTPAGASSTSQANRAVSLSPSRVRVFWNFFRVRLHDHILLYNEFLLYTKDDLSY